MAGLTLLFGQDHPAGKWSERHLTPATALAIRQSHEVHYDNDEKHLEEKDDKDLEEAVVSVEPVIQSTLDVAVNESLTLRSALKILASPMTWLPALAYLTTFGVELAIDNTMADVLFSLFNKKLSGFDQTKAGYYTSIL